MHLNVYDIYFLCKYLLECLCEYKCRRFVFTTYQILNEIKEKHFLRHKMLPIQFSFKLTKTILSYEILEKIDDDRLRDCHSPYIRFSGS